MNDQIPENRRSFLKQSGVTLAAGLTAAELTGITKAYGAAHSENEKINVGIIGVGGRGGSLLRWVRGKDDAKIVAVCDVYVKRRKAAAVQAGLDPDNEKDCVADYKDILSRDDVDAVIIATPDHWHARISIDAMKAGKDVYCEKPMTKTVEEAKQVWETMEETKRVMQIGSQTTSSDQWWKAKEAISKGMLGKLIMSQGSYHRNSLEGEWNYSIDEDAGPNADGDNYIDWETWLGSAPKREFDPNRFFRFRQFWDYSGGIATDLFYHVMAPMNICWPEAQFPYKVMASGGIYVFKDAREVPDTFALMAEYPGEHQVVLSSSMANDTHIPGLIRGHEATMMIVEHGQFEGNTPEITVTAQPEFKDSFKEKWGDEKVVFKTDRDSRPDHMQNWLNCIKSREKPVLDALTAYKAMVTIAMSVESYRSGKVLYFDAEKQRVVSIPPKA